MATNPEVKRIVAEVVGTSATAVAPTPSVSKAVAEVIGQHQALQFAQPSVNRLIEEIVGSAARLGSGLNLPALNITDFTLFMVMNPINWSAASGHEFSMVSDEPNKGIFINQTENANEIEIMIRSGVDGVYKGRYTVANINAKHIVTLRFDTAGAGSLIRVNGNVIGSPTKTGTFDALILRYLCSLIQYGHKVNGELAEVVLYTNQLSAGFIDLMEAYLTCKWIGAGPNPSNNFCVPV